MKEMEDSNVFIRDPVGLREKLKAFLKDGPTKTQVCFTQKFARFFTTIAVKLILVAYFVLQCIADFDGTLTRGSYKGEKAQSSFGNDLCITIFAHTELIIVMIALFYTAVVARSSLMPEDVEKRVIY